MEKLKEIKKDFCDKLFWKEVMIVFLIGIFTSFPYFAETILNHDAITSPYTDFDWLLEQGKWFVTPITSIKGAFDLPYLGGIMGLMFLAVSAGIIWNMLGIREKWKRYVTGILLVTFPSFAAIMIYHCADYFGLTFLLAVLAAYFSSKGGWLNNAVSVVILTLSLGAYQAYIGVTASLMLLILMEDLMEDRVQTKKIICRGLKFLSILLISCTLYYVILQVRLYMTGTQLSDYKNAAGMSSILNPLVLVGSIRHAYIDFVKFYWTDILSGNSGVLLYAYRFLCIGYLIGMIVVVFKKMKKKNILQALLMALIGVFFFPLACNAIGVLSNNSSFYYISIYPFVIFPIAVLLVLWNKKSIDANKVYQGAFSFLTGCVLVCCYCWIVNNNTAHQKMVYANQQIESKATTLVAQIQNCPGYTEGMDVVFVGYLPYHYFEPEGVSSDMEVFYTKDMGTRNAMELLYGVGRLEAYIKNYISPHMNLSQAETVSGENGTIIQEMPVYPNAGSIEIIDGVLYVKLGSTE